MIRNFVGNGYVIRHDNDFAEIDFYERFDALILQNQKMRMIAYHIYS